jgi:hypothetical protein
VGATAEDEDARRALEDAVAGRLRRAGATAFAAHGLLAANAPAEALRALAGRLGLDAQLSLALSIDSRRETTPTRVTVVPAVTYWGSPRAIGRPPAAFYTPERTRQTEALMLTATLQQVPTDHVVWFAASERLVAGPLPRVAAGFAPLVVDALDECGLIAAPQ